MCDEQSSSIVFLTQKALQKTIADDIYLQARKAARAQRQAELTARLIADNAATTAYIMGGHVDNTPQPVTVFRRDQIDLCLYVSIYLAS